MDCWAIWTAENELPNQAMKYPSYFIEPRNPCPNMTTEWSACFCCIFINVLLVGGWLMGLIIGRRESEPCASIHTCAWMRHWGFTMDYCSVRKFWIQQFHSFFYGSVELFAEQIIGSSLPTWLLLLMFLQTVYVYPLLFRQSLYVYIHSHATYWWKGAWPS